MLGVRQANERDFFRCPVTPKGLWAIRAYGQDFRVTRGKSRILVAQRGEMGAAIWSHKTAQENQDNIFLTTKVKQTDRAAMNIRQLKIGRTL
jgi:hypothetical protein